MPKVYVEVVVSIFLLVIGVLDLFPPITTLCYWYAVYAFPWAIYKWQSAVLLSKMEVKPVFWATLMILILI